MMIVENGGNPYLTTDIRHRMWEQNKQSASETRGHVGYVLVKSKYMTDYHNSSVYTMLCGGNKTVYLHRAPIGIIPMVSTGMITINNPTNIYLKLHF